MLASAIFGALSASTASLRATLPAISRSATAGGASGA
jgi:hypothetical protein